jgi:hypothetical protein
MNKLINENKVLNLSMKEKGEVQIALSEYARQQRFHLCQQEGELGKEPYVI